MSDNKNIIKCPACGKEMSKIYIQSVNCNIDICVEGCGGVFFDNREFQKFDEQHENIDEILAQYKDKEYIKQDESLNRICPVCGSVMVKHKTSAKGNVEVDDCYYCGAIFLDYGELQAIRSEYKTEVDRKEAFAKIFKNEHNIGDFENYKSKTKEEMFDNNPNVKKVFSENNINRINWLIEFLK